MSKNYLDAAFCLELCGVGGLRGWGRDMGRWDGEVVSNFLKFTSLFLINPSLADHRICPAFANNVDPD